MTNRNLIVPHWVGASDCALTPPEEPCVKVSLHTARASPRTFGLSDVPQSDTLGAFVHHSRVGRFGNTGMWPSSLRFQWSQCGMHQATGVARHLLFPLEDGSTYFLALRDQTDVGISGALHASLGFFGHLHAGSATLPCGWGGHDSRGRGHSVSMFCIRYGRV